MLDRPVVQLVRPSELSNQVPYAYAAIPAPGTRLVQFAGACPLDADGRTVAPGDVAAQAAQCMRNVSTALASVGGVLTDVVFLRVLVATADRADLSEAWQVVHEAMAGHEPPGTLLGVTVLGWPDQLVEVEVVAAVFDPAE